MVIKKFHMKWIVWFSLNAVMGAGLLLVLSKINHGPSSINNSLSEIQSQLIGLQQIMKTPTEKTDFSAINHDVNRLETIIHELKTKDDGQLNRVLTYKRHKSTTGF